MPLEFLKFVAACHLPYNVNNAHDARLARQCAATGYLDLAESPPPDCREHRDAVILQVLTVLPEGYRAMELLDGFDKGSGFVGL